MFAVSAGNPEIYSLLCIMVADVMGNKEMLIDMYHKTMGVSLDEAQRISREYTEMHRRVLMRSLPKLIIDNGKKK